MVKIRYIGPIDEIELLGLSRPYRMRRGMATLVAEEDADRLLEDPAFELVDDEVLEESHGNNCSLSSRAREVSLSVLPPGHTLW